MSATYLRRSTWADDELGLQTAAGVTPTGRVAHPELFTGFLARPDVAAAGLLAVADVAASRYADAGQAQRLANLDPVITASGDQLRLESFSACNGVQARLDLLPDGIDSGNVAFGTTNVDVNTPLRTALAGMGRDALVHVAVGDEQLRISTPEASWSEDKVALPQRWVRGFAEVPAVAAGTSPLVELTGPAIARFMAGLPRGGGLLGPRAHLEARSGLKPVPRPTSSSITVDGVGRLRSAARLARFATALQVRRGAHGASVWVWQLPGARFTLHLSAGAYKGFSGGGSLLTLLADPAGQASATTLLGHLAWQPRLDREHLRSASGLASAAVDAGLAWLAASGRVGFDAAEQAWFHRELPVTDLQQALTDHPRLAGAHHLVERGAVTPDGERAWSLAGSRGDVYRVVEQDGVLVCDCAWACEAAAGRGPCKHVLAVTLSSTAPRSAS